MKKELSYKETHQIKVSADSYVGLVCKTGFKYPREIIFWTDCTPWNGNALLSCNTNEKEADTIMEKVEELPERTREAIVETVLNYIASRGGSIRRVDKGWRGISYVCSL